MFIENNRKENKEVSNELLTLDQIRYINEQLDLYDNPEMSKSGMFL